METTIIIFHKIMVNQSKSLVNHSNSIEISTKIIVWDLKDPKLSKAPIRHHGRSTSVMVSPTDRTSDSCDDFEVKSHGLGKRHAMSLPPKKTGGNHHGIMALETMASECFGCYLGKAHLWFCGNHGMTAEGHVMRLMRCNDWLNPDQIGGNA